MICYRVVCGITGRSYTYSRLRDHSAAFAVNLSSKLNLQIGDVIAVCLPNMPEFPIAALGAIEAGLVLTTINPTYTAEEIQRQLEASNSKAIIGTPNTFATINEAVKNSKKDIKIICIKTEADQSFPSGAINFADLIDTNNVDFSLLRPHKRHPDDMAFLPFSSGTTGLPKGVMLSHNNIGVNCEQIGVKIGDSTIVRPTTTEYQDVSPSVLPFFHIYGFTVLMISKLALGAKIVTLPEFKPNTFLDSIRNHKATLLHVVPPILIYLGQHDGVNPKDLECVRAVMSGAAPLGALDVEQFFQKAPNTNIVQGYGLTETSPAALLNMPGNSKYASVGVPASATRCKIVAVNDSTGVGLQANQTGELWVKGPQNMIGYLNNKKATDEMLVDGWIRTGDIAYYDDDGFFYITDRLKELIKVKGFQVAPAELEEILRSHPEITDAAVVGVTHAKTGEAPRAFVIKRPDSKITENDIQKFMSQKVADYKQLHGGIQFLETIPKNATGKIMRREIKLKYCQ
ncbi:uncharacterized protein LOC129580588 isoform X2 [Sitodiplosis mosellana]|uniref:uncharacterized protein LOC129580588 isoform X2 n=1 Tax=Sitodiplosis mosellana TaxID=263140 RepID=UPI002444D462|nr:uncharacterized protein LOC129580588 isoform X2 [Sitodiplosis mosellana]